MWDVRSALVTRAVGFQRTERRLAADTEEIVLPPEKCITHAFLHQAFERQLTVFPSAQGRARSERPREREREREKREREREREREIEMFPL